MKRLASFAHRLFYDPGTRSFAIVNNVLAALTLISVLALILETVPELAAYDRIFRTVEYVAVAFFTIEYLLRILAERKDVGAYALSFFGIIDLLAIVPTYLGLTNLTFLKTARVLRILRLLRMIRLAKLARFEHRRRRDLEDYRHLYRLNVGIYFFALLAAMILFGTLIYIGEGGIATFGSIPLGMLWAAKLLLGGVAQEQPVTVYGEMIAIAARFTGLVLFGLLIAIIGNTAKRLLFGSATIEQEVRSSRR